MDTHRPWTRNYPTPADLPGNIDEDNAGLAGWRTERLENPEQVFIDIYGLLDYLKKPGNLQLRGRRGTGKTMYFLKGQHEIGYSFESGLQQEVISAYVDLKAIHQFNEIPSFLLRAEMIYREVIKAITFGIENKQGVHRYCLSDYIQNVDFTRRWGLNSSIKKLAEILDTPIHKMFSEDALENFYQVENQIISRERNKNEPSPSAVTQENLDRSYFFNRSLINELRNMENGSFSQAHQQIHNLLLKILDGLKVSSLSLFIDELSSPNVLQGIQIPLIDRLVATFPGERLSIKIATVPGTSVVYENVKNTENSTGKIPDNFSTFDFETQAIKNPDIIETGNFEVFLRNMANADSRYLPYLDPHEPERGFDSFLADTFESYTDFLEFIKASEGLPRQMLETFHNAETAKHNYNPQGKLSSLHIQIAARQSLQVTYQSQILGSKKCEEILSRIYKVNSRVIKIERIPEYNNSVDLLTHWGFIHACPIPPTNEPEVSKYLLEYFYTSYRMEVANQMSHAGEKISQEIDDLATIQKDKLKELYPKARPVILSNM